MVKKKEQWRSLPKYSRYEISSNGNTRRKTQDGSYKYLRKSKYASGGFRVTLYDDNGSFKCFALSKLVLTLFKGNPPKPTSQVKYIDGDKNNLCIDNLEWMVSKKDIHKLKDDLFDNPNEIWKPIPNFSRYESSNMGRLRSVNYKNSGRVKLLKPALNKDGYLKTMLLNDTGKYNTVSVHRMVILTFEGESSEPYRQQINHIDGVKSNNNIDNLEWCSCSENCQHSFDIGLQQPKRGALNGMAKLTKEQVEYAREKKRNGGMFWGRRQLAQELGITEKHLQRVVNSEKSWMEY